MLNKTICTKCFTEHWKSDIESRYSRFNIGEEWYKDKESNELRLERYVKGFHNEWDNQDLCQCPLERYPISIQRAVPPEKCPYVLEQLYES